MTNTWRVDGHDWLVQERPHEPGTYDIDWLSGPNPGYGFTIGRNDRSSIKRKTFTREISNFLAGINPATGYLD